MLCDLVELDSTRDTRGEIEPADLRVRFFGSGSTANAFTFTGEQTDASTGLEYLRARYYDPATGMFLSIDPLGDGYDYAYDNPVMNTDPSGLACLDAESFNKQNPFKSPGARRRWEESMARLRARLQCGGDGLIAPAGGAESAGGMGSAGDPIGPDAGSAAAIPDPTQTCDVFSQVGPVGDHLGLVYGATVECNFKVKVLALWSQLERYDVKKGKWVVEDRAKPNVCFGKSTCVLHDLVWNPPRNSLYRVRSFVGCSDRTVKFAPVPILERYYP